MDLKRFFILFTCISTSIAFDQPLEVFSSNAYTLELNVEEALASLLNNTERKQFDFALIQVRPEISDDWKNKTKFGLKDKVVKVEGLDQDTHYLIRPIAILKSSSFSKIILGPEILATTDECITLAPDSVNDTYYDDIARFEVLEPEINCRIAFYSVCITSDLKSNEECFPIFHKLDRHSLNYTFKKEGFYIFQLVDAHGLILAIKASVTYTSTYWKPKVVLAIAGGTGIQLLLVAYTIIRHRRKNKNTEETVV